VSGAAPEAVPDEALSGWEALRATASGGLRGQYEYRRQAAVDGKESPALTLAMEFGASPQGMFVKKTVQGESKVSAFNAEYGIDVAQRSAGSAFQLGDLRRGEAIEEMREKVRSIWTPFVHAGYSIFGKALPDLVNRPGFTLVSLERDVEHATATMKFEYAHGDDENEYAALNSGTVTFATDKDWAISRYQCEAGFGQTAGTIEYQPFEGSFLPKTATLEYTSTSRKEHVRNSYTLQEVEKLPAGAPLPVHLADYGLPEPEVTLTPAPRTGWWLVALNAALVVIIVAVRYAIRRRHAPAFEHAQ
jgi:hypothetical protein